MSQTVYLTSFKKNHEEQQEGDTPWSIAVYQPKWLPALPETRVFDIRDDGAWVRPRDFLTPGHDPTLPDIELIKRYRDKLLGMYAERRDEIGDFLRVAGDVVCLCCWCPYDKAAQRQLHDYGSFVCHSAVVELFLDIAGVEVMRDDDRKDMVVL